MSFFEDLFDNDHRRGRHGYEHDDDHHGYGRQSNNRYDERYYGELVHCRRCSVELIPGARFCHQCGAPSLEMKPKCSSCQKEMQVGAKFCPHCGAEQS